MATVTEKEIRGYYPKQRQLRCRFVVDGVKEVFKNVNNVGPSGHTTILDREATKLEGLTDENEVNKAVEELEGDIGNWAARPEGSIKQGIAQQAVRNAIDYAREGKVLQADGRTRSQAFSCYAKCRPIKNKIWDELDYIGNHVEKAAYLELEGPGSDTVYGELNSFMNSLDSAAPDWNAVVFWMDTCPNPKKIV